MRRLRHLRPPDAAALTALGLHALQHRGQEAAGIVSFDGKRFHTERQLGLVGDVFSDARVIDRCQGKQAIGHVRYSTTGETILRNVQPLFSPSYMAAASPWPTTAT
jgi:amidophosphoribosyltransferase